MQIYALPIWIVTRPKGSSVCIKFVTKDERVSLAVCTRVCHCALGRIFVDRVREVGQFCDLPSRVYGIQALWGFAVHQAVIGYNRVSGEQGEQATNQDDNGTNVCPSTGGE